MVNGDFSSCSRSIGGTNGETITVSSGGQFTVRVFLMEERKLFYQRLFLYLLMMVSIMPNWWGKIIQITTGADGKVSSVALNQ